MLQIGLSTNEDDVARVAVLKCTATRSPVSVNIATTFTLSVTNSRSSSLKYVEELGTFRSVDQYSIVLESRLRRER